MIPKLILIGGEAWTGKSTCADRLFRRLDNSAWLDGDDVWCVNPWPHTRKPAQEAFHKLRKA